MEYADPQLMSSFLAISVTVITKFSYVTELIQHCSLFLKWSDDPTGLHQRCLLCHLEHFHTLQLILSVMQFSPHFATVPLLVPMGFTPSDHKSRMTARCSTALGSEIGTDMFAPCLLALT
jgi:hypothetical protein